MFLMTLMILLGFFAGAWRATPASAQARQKWDYQLIKLGGMEPNTGGGFEVRGLAKMGEDGWEVVGINDSWALLKRSR